MMIVYINLGKYYNLATHCHIMPKCHDTKPFRKRMVSLNVNDNALTLSEYSMLRNKKRIFE